MNQSHDPSDEHTYAWRVEDARRVRATPETTIPLVDPTRVARLLPDHYLWDSWPVCDREGNVASLGGWHALVGLTASRELLPEERHDVANLRYLISRGDGVWLDRGPLFPDGAALGARQWAGSTIYDADTRALTVFYTPTGGEDEPAFSYEQRIASARATVVASGDGIELVDWSPHRALLEGGHGAYAPTRGTGGGPGKINAFRDPAYFRDPVSRRDFLLFTASLAGSAHEHNGLVGIAELDADTGECRALPPLIGADGVNNELERPHLLVKDGRYYLFFTTHGWTFAPPLKGPEGLYGFVSDSLRGEYRPLNGCGLVIGNPETEPLQTYSWLVLPNGWVLSFLDYFDLQGRDVNEESKRNPAFQRDHFGGTVAPMLRIEIDGDTTKLVEQREDLLLER